jgi:hypothetical protein
MRILGVNVILSEAKDLVFTTDVSSFPKNEILRRFTPRNDINGEGVSALQHVILSEVKDPYDVPNEFATS